MTKIDLSLFDISHIEEKYKKRHSHIKNPHDDIAFDCDRPNCHEPAYYKAPKNPQNLTEYRYFCLKHIREHNERWNYCENMNADDIISHIEKDVVGHRPTWQSGMSVGGNGKGTARQKQKTHHQKPFAFDDPFDLAKKIFDRVNPHDTTQKSKKQKIATRYDNGLQKIHDACATLEIEFPPVMIQLKQNYKKLVKQYHPDINKHDVNAEKKLRHVLDAYRMLKDFLELNSA